MPRASFLVVGITLLAAGVRAGDTEDANKADLKRLQGKWKVVSHKYDGQSLKPGATWTISGNKLLEGAGWYLELTLNAKEKPKALDFDRYDAGGRLRRGESGFKSIYAFKGEDTLEWCMTAIAGRPRPGAFESKKGDGNIFYVLERVKE
jgi:uncharacterized protein (TIGR03067 family)